MGLPDDEQKKWDDLEKRVKEARKDQNEDNTPVEQEESPDAQKSANAGASFLSTVIASAALGFGIDWYFDTTPWGMIFLILIGFISGVIQANNAMKKNAEENDNS